MNDRFGDEGIIIIYCPLCGSGTVSKAKVAGNSLQFGVSGLLYNSDVLMYDRQTQSLWSQILSRAVTGPMKGIILPAVVVTHTTWADWSLFWFAWYAVHPQTEIYRVEIKN